MRLEPTGFSRFDNELVLPVMGAEGGSVFVGGVEHGQRSVRVNLLNWDGRQVPAGMFPEEQKQ